MAPTKKNKAGKANETIAARLALAVKSGKYSLGYKSALKHMRGGKGECVYSPSRGLEREAEKVPFADNHIFWMLLRIHAVLLHASFVL